MINSLFTNKIIAQKRQEESFSSKFTFLDKTEGVCRINFSCSDFQIENSKGKFGVYLSSSTVVCSTCPNLTTSQQKQFREQNVRIPVTHQLRTCQCHSRSWHAFYISTWKVAMSLLQFDVKARPQFLQSVAYIYITLYNNKNSLCCISYTKLKTWSVSLRRA